MSRPTYDVTDRPTYNTGLPYGWAAWRSLPRLCPRNVPRRLRRLRDLPSHRSIRGEHFKCHGPLRSGDGHGV